MALRILLPLVILCAVLFLGLVVTGLTVDALYIQVALMTACVWMVVWIARSIKNRVVYDPISKLELAILAATHPRPDGTVRKPGSIGARRDKASTTFWIHIAIQIVTAGICAAAAFLLALSRN